VEALSQRLESVEIRTNVVAELIVQGDFADLPPNVEEEIFNIAQEALNNSLKHARAEHVRVFLSEGNRQISLIVEDDGKGFDPHKRFAGMGLGTMQERARSIGGKLTIQSEQDHGSRVTFSVAEMRDRL
jgi:signal transduction histidine kinase